MLDLPQHHAQAFARALYPHLQSRNPGPCESGHLFITQIFDMLQQECFPLVRLEPPQGSVDLFPPFPPFRRMLG